MNQERIKQYRRLEMNRADLIAGKVTNERIAAFTDAMLAVWHIMTDEEQEEVTAEKGPMWRYVKLAGEHHEEIYVHRGKGAHRERELKEQLQSLWKGLGPKDRALVTRVSGDASTVPPSADADTEVSRMTVALRSVLTNSMDAVRSRTESLLYRRLGGNIPGDDTDLEDEFKIFSTEARVPQPWYKSYERSEFLDHYVKIGLETDSGMDTPYEYVWVDNVEFYDEPDSSILEPDQLKGILYDEPIDCENFSRGDIVTFKVIEIQDCILRPSAEDPTRVSSFHEQHLEEGLTGVVMLLMNLPAFTATPITKEMAEMTWGRMSDREQHHLISFTRTLRGRGTP
jgi:hypothetical protein